MKWGPKAGANSAKCDLYKELYQIIDDKTIELTVKWMPSRLKEGDPRPKGVSELGVIANDHADQLARKAADLVQSPILVTSNYISI